MKRFLLMLGVIVGALMTFVPPVLCGIDSIVSLWGMAGDNTNSSTIDSTSLATKALWISLVISPLGLATFALSLVFYLRTRKVPPVGSKLK